METTKTLISHFVYFPFNALFVSSAERLGIIEKFFVMQRMSKNRLKMDSSTAERAEQKKGSFSGFTQGPKAEVTTESFF